MTAVRPIRPDEVVALHGLRLRALSTDPDAFDQTVQDAEDKGLAPMAELVDSAAAGRDLVLVTETRGGLDGLVVVSRSRRPRSQHRARLWGMWVAPEARGRGVGGALLDGAIEWCQEQGVEMVDLWVVTDHLGAIRVYERAGFRICGTTHDGMRWQGRPQDEHQMTLHLTLRRTLPGESSGLVETRRR